MKCKFDNTSCNGKVNAYKFGMYDINLCSWHKKSRFPEAKLKIPQPFYYKKGQKLWYVYVDDETGKCELWEYVVRTIRRPWIYAIRKMNGITWVKLSKRHGDFGWAYPINPLYRDRIRYGRKFSDLYTTKRQAWMNVKKEFSNIPKCDIEFYDKDIVKKILTTSKRMITKIQKEKLK